MITAKRRRFKVIKKRAIHMSSILLLSLLLTFPLANGVMAAGEIEFVFEYTFTSAVPVYMSGHNGDPNWIERFNYMANVFFEGSFIGTASGNATFVNPPISLTDRYTNVILTEVISFPGIGTFQVTAQGIGLSSSTSPVMGDLTISYAGSISNGTGDILDVYGTTGGSGILNIFTGTGNLKNVIRARFGY